MCLQPAERDLATPEGIKKYRKSFKEQCGVTIVHPGLVGQQLPPTTFPYGVPTQKSEGANSILRAGYKEGVGSFVQDLQERDKYDSLKREPLARTIDRQYRFPEQTNKEEFRFGLATETNKWGVKDTIYSA